jgi:penicillin amidase
MKKISLKFTFPLLTLVLVIVLLNTQLNQIPALGSFFNPYSGVVQCEKESLNNQLFSLKGREFVVYFDEHQIPHVFSENEKDLHFAQGYTISHDRLWQMDFMSYASAGRLSEIMGEQYLVYDRMQRRTGVLVSAKKTLGFIEKNTITKEVLDNYTAGVNAYISSLNKADLPFEYKLLNYKPEPWTNLKSVLIMKYVGSMLTGYEEDVSSSYLLSALGEKDFFKLYPDYKLTRDSLQIDLEQLMTDLPHEQYIDYSFLFKTSKISKSEFNPRLGSNAWAVSPKKSKSGNPILCNDPHLNLTFPSIWYEIQLKSDERNVYGYSIPGTPGVIIGFNEKISWGITNGATDARDWYKLELKEDYSAYKMDDKWKDTKAIIEEIKIRGKDVYYDTIYYSEHGPIVISDSYDQSLEVKDYALKWALHNESNEFLAILMMNKSLNKLEFEESINHFQFPIQNFIYADSKGNIASYHQGEILKRNGRGDGKFILDGTKSKYLFYEKLDQDELPKQVNPVSNFVFSANNSPWDSKSKYYINGYYAELRANKIQEILSESEKFDIQDMKSMQLDNTNRLAELALPILLGLMNDVDRGFKERISNWDCKYEENSELAIFFETWWKLIEYHTWDEIYEYDQFLRYPDDLVLLDLIKNEPNSKFFNEKDTDIKENAKMIVSKSFSEAISEFNEHEPIVWKDTNKVSIMHLTNIKALSKTNFGSAGHPEALNAISSNWGPSMRMIVEMADRPIAYGMVAGGTSGNPASKHYDSFVDNWLEGKYHKMVLYMNKDEAEAKSSRKWTFK